MKKLFFLLVVGISVFGLAASGLASLMPGSWSLGTGIKNGIWFETYGGPTGDGSLGSKVYGKSYDGGLYGKQWDLQGGPLVEVGLASTTGPAGETKYRTKYSGAGASMDLGNGPWGSGGTVDIHCLINESYHEAGTDDLVFDLVGFGSYDGLGVIFNAIYNGPEKALGWGTHDGHQSVSATAAFDEVNMTVTPIPGTFLLFGAGLLGLAGLRRRFRK